MQARIRLSFPDDFLDPDTVPAALRSFLLVKCYQVFVPVISVIYNVKGGEVTQDREVTHNAIVVKNSDNSTTS